jgi:hypothetical protein
MECPFQLLDSLRAQFGQPLKTFGSGQAAEDDIDCGSRKIDGRIRQTYRTLCRIIETKLRKTPGGALYSLALCEMT